MNHGSGSAHSKNEDHGTVYRIRSGAQQDALAILPANGVNYARLKVWVNPADGYNNRARVLTMATRVRRRLGEPGAVRTATGLSQPSASPSAVSGRGVPPLAACTG
jgi:Glycosyl hydrolase family 53